MNFTVKKTLQKEFNGVVIMLSNQSPLLQLKEIFNALTEQHIEGIILIDQFLHSKNEKERFISIKTGPNSLIKSSMRYCKLPKNSYYYKIAQKEFLKHTINTTVCKI